MDYADITINLINKQSYDLKISEKNQSILDKNALRVKKCKALLNHEDGTEQVSKKIAGNEMHQLQYNAINLVNLLFTDQ